MECGKTKIPIAYIWIYRKMQDRGDLIRTSVAIEVLKRNFYRFPATILYKILKDMEKYNLIQKINTKKGYRILPVHRKELVIINGFL